MATTTIDCPKGEKIYEFSSGETRLHAFLIPKDDMDNIWPGSSAYNAGIYLYVGVPGKDAVDGSGTEDYKRELYLGYVAKRTEGAPWTDRVKETGSLSAWKERNWRYTFLFVTADNSWTIGDIRTIMKRMEDGIKESGTNELIGKNDVEIPSLMDPGVALSEEETASAVKSMEKAMAELAVKFKNL